MVVQRREALVKRAPHHRGYELVHISVFDVFGHDQLAVAKHRHVIAYLEHLIHLMRDIYNCDALLLERAHHLKELVDLTCHKRRCRLVKDDDFRIVRDGLRDLTHLALRYGHLAHRLGEVDRHAKAPKELGSLFFHAALIDHT